MNLSAICVVDDQTQFSMAGWLIENRPKISENQFQWNQKLVIPHQNMQTKYSHTHSYRTHEHSTHSSTCMHCACILNTIQNTDNTWPQSQNKKNLENCVTAGIIGNGNRQAWMSCICEGMWVLSVCIHGYRSIYTYRINAESPNEASNGFCGLWSNVNNMALATTIIDQQKKVNNTNDDDNNNSNLLLLLYVRIMRYFFLYQENAMPNTNKIFRSISNVHFTQQVRHKRSVQEIPISQNSALSHPHLEGTRNLCGAICAIWLCFCATNSNTNTNHSETKDTLTQSQARTHKYPTIYHRIRMLVYSHIHFPQDDVGSF